MILNQQRVPVWVWDGISESKCPLCGEPLVARRCQDRVWHWAHKPYTNQKQGTCLFDDSEWALKWRLSYHEFEGWKIEVPWTIPPNPVNLSAVGSPPVPLARKKILIHAMNPNTWQVREFVGHINDANEDRFNFLMGAKHHNVCWMFNGKEWARALAKQVGGKGGLKEFLKPKAQALYERICAAGQNALVHIEGADGGTLYKEWVKKPADDAPKGTVPERTGVWFPLVGEQAMAVLDKFAQVVLPYNNARSEAAPAKNNPLKKLMERV